MATTVAGVMAATLKASGVRRVYGIPGDSLNGSTRALRRDGTIGWEHVRYEEAAGFAAAAQAALTGELAVCAASCGPGNLQLINGLFDANRSGTPVLAIVPHIPSAEIGGEYFQETHPQELFRECSVYCVLVCVHASPMRRGGAPRTARPCRARRVRGARTAQLFGSSQAEERLDVVRRHAVDHEPARGGVAHDPRREPADTRSFRSRIPDAVPEVTVIHQAALRNSTGHSARISPPAWRLRWR
jgi:hypothetical protein